MTQHSIVIDTNVFITALRSRSGASYKLLMLLGSPKFTLHISVPLILEYEAVAKRLLGDIALTAQDIDAILDYICAVAREHRLFYLWRPYLKDPQDDMVLELASAACCDFIVTYNQADFKGADVFGVSIITPAEFLKKIGELK